MPFESFFQDYEFLKQGWRVIEIVSNATIGRIGLLAVTVSIIFLILAFWYLLRYFFERLKKESLKYYEFQYAMGRYFIKFITFLIPGLFLCSFSYVISDHFVIFPGVRLIQYGEMTLTSPGKNTFRVQLNPVLQDEPGMTFKGEGQRLYLVGFFVDCPGWMRWVLYSSRFRFLGFGVSRTIMDIPTETKLTKEWKDKLPAGAKILYSLGRTLHMCRTHIMSSITLKPGKSRFIVFVTPKGFMLQSIPYRKTK